MESEYTFNQDTFDAKLAEFISGKKSFFVFVYGAHDQSGKSWCPDCDKAQPFVNEGKRIIMSNADKKLFVNLPVVKSEREAYSNSKIVKLTRIPSLIYFNLGREMGRIIEDEMGNETSVVEFIKQAYD